MKKSKIARTGTRKRILSAATAMLMRPGWRDGCRQQRLPPFFVVLPPEAGAADPLKLAGAIVATMVGAVMLAKPSALPNASSTLSSGAKKLEIYR